MHVSPERNMSLSHAFSFDECGPPSTTMLLFLLVDFQIICKRQNQVLMSIENDCLMQIDRKEEGNVEEDGL